MRETLRAEQRAWVKVENKEFGPRVFQQPLMANVTLDNIGKTPASDLRMDSAIEIVPNGSTPRFDFRGSHMNNTVGVLWPNAPFKFPVLLLDQKGTVLLNQGTLDALNSGKAYLVVYGNITYRTLGEVHWVHYCSWRWDGPNMMEYSARECTQYNAIDD